MIKRKNLPEKLANNLATRAFVLTSVFTRSDIDAVEYFFCLFLFIVQEDQTCNRKMTKDDILTSRLNQTQKYTQPHMLLYL